MVVKNVDIAVLVEDTKSSAKPHLQAKHGLAFFIKAKTDNSEVTIMMDTGPSSDQLLHNANAMDINLQKTDIITLSHGHYDHTGGLIRAIKQMKKDVPVIAHPKIFDPKLKMKPHLKFIGTLCKPSTIESTGGVPLLAAGPVKITNGIMTTGEVQRTTAFEKIRGFWTVHNGSFVEDLMLDDQALLINVENKGVVVVAGCAHSGIINTIKHAQDITETSRIYAILGGFHLINADDERIQATVEELKKLNPKFIGPCHCTGAKATKKIAETFGDRCRPLHTGDIVKL